MLVEVQYEAHRHERRHEFQRLTGAAAGVLSRASMLMRRRSPLQQVYRQLLSCIQARNFLDSFGSM